MRRRILIALLALGTVGGYASGFASLKYRSHCRRAWMEQRAPASAEAPTPPGPR
jgi:hypothetical protein